MSQIFVTGGTELHGRIEISGAKNAALPIIAATLLTKQPIKLLNIPNLSDVHDMLALVQSCKKGFVFKNNKVTIFDSDEFIDFSAADLSYNRIRASCLLLGPMLGIKGEVLIKMPGGCAIGERPIDLHIFALQKMGAKFEFKNGMIKATTKGLRGASIKFAKVSVGATQNVMMAATVAQGRTTIVNAATEPEVIDLANFLVKMGAKINGIGTRELTIEGVSDLYSCEYKIIPDRIEAGTYMILLAATGGKITLKNITGGYLKNLTDKLDQTRALKFCYKKDSVVVEKIDKIHPVNIATDAYPGFSTDLQAQFTALMCLADGRSKITENIFENRFMYVSELKSMGAKIEIVNQKRIDVNGVADLGGRNLVATDLRAGAALLIASLAAKGDSVINNSRCIDRGYYDIQSKLNRCGAQIFKKSLTSFAAKFADARVAS